MGMVQATTDRNILSWLISNEKKNYREIKNLIDFELSEFNSWESKLNSEIQELEEEQIRIKAKPESSRTEDDWYVLNLDVSDLMSADDENMVDFKQEVLEMLVVKLYSKTERFLKVIFSFSQDKNASGIKKVGGNIKEWIGNYQKKLSVDLESITNYTAFNTLRILNNSIKHSDGNFSKETAKSIFSTQGFYVLPFFCEPATCSALSAITEHDDFLTKCGNINNHIKLNSTDIEAFHKKLCEFFDDLCAKAGV